MGKATKRLRKEDSEEEDVEINSDFEVDSDDMNSDMLQNAGEGSSSDYDEDELDGQDDDDEVEEMEANESGDDDDDDDEEGDEGEDDASGEEGEEEEEDHDNEEDEDDDDMNSENSDEAGRLNAESKGAEMEELEKEVMEIRHKEQDLLRNLKRHKDEDVLQGQAVKNQKALWDRALECRFLLQKAFSNSNRLPQEPIRSLFYSSSDGIGEAYSSLISSSKKTLDSILELQEALLEKNPAIDQSISVNPTKKINIKISEKSNEETDDEEWAAISQMQSRMATYRDKSIDKWHRKTQVTSGTAAIKGNLEAFNQHISAQVAAYMRDPSKMIKGMQQNRSCVALFGRITDSPDNLNQAIKADGDPELLDDSEFYQQLLKEFLETVDPSSSETAFYALKRFQTKKRKIVDRRASKSRKIRYHVHEKIKNFMAPEPMALPDMAPKLFSNLFALKTQRSAS